MSKVEEECIYCQETDVKTVPIAVKSYKIVGLTVLSLTGVCVAGVYAVATPFLLPAFRRICLPFVPATTAQVEHVMKALKNRTGSVIDLGSGDGRIVLAAAKQGFNAVGVELNPWLVWYSRLVARYRGLHHVAKFQRSDLWKIDYSQFSNVIIFGVDKMMPILEKKLSKELPVDGCVIACRFPLPTWKELSAIGSGTDKVWVYYHPQVSYIMDEVSLAFTKLINNNESNDILQLLSELQGSKQLFRDVKEHLSFLENDAMSAVWTCLQTICADTLVTSCTEKDSQDEVKKFDSGCSVLNGIATIALLTLEQSTDNIPEGLVQTAVILNGILISLPSSQFKLKTAIAVLCEKWCSSKIDGRKNLFTNLFIYLLQKVTAEKYLKLDIKRLWNLRNEFNSISFQNEAGKTTKQLLLACIKSSNLLNNNDGLKILSCILCLDKEVMLELHKAAKENLPFCTRLQARAYGEIFCKAWSVMTGDMKEKFEHDCIQDVMFHAIHAKANPRSPFPNLKEFLSVFHSLRHQKDIGTMVFKLYEPILWRSFTVPSSTVRGNTAAILIDTFPLENVELSNNENDEWQQKQFALITALLMDPCPNIRMMAAHGVGIICDRYWAMIPNNVIHKWVMTLIDELRFDAASVGVRVNVFKGLTRLLNNPLSHQFLKNVLPKVQGSFHDVSETVRVAVVELLLKLINQKSIEYWTVVSPDHLFARLAVDTPPVARRIVKLLKTSFFPKNQENGVVLERAIFFIKKHRAASRKFYRFVHEYMDLKESVIFLLQINPCLMHYAHRKFLSYKKDLEDIGPDDSENIDPNVGDVEDKEEDDCLDDPDTLAGLIDIVGIVWAGIYEELRKPENLKLEKKLQETYKDSMELFARSCKDNACWDSIMFLTSFLPSNQVLPICKHCLLRIRTLPAGSTSDVFGTYVVNLCRLDFMEELCEILSLWLSAALNPQSTPSRSNKRLRKGVRFEEPYEKQPVLACDILCWMLEEPYCQEILLFNRPPVLACWHQLKSCLELIEERLNGKNKNSDEFFEKAFNTYCRLTIILQKEPLHESVRLMSEVLDWVKAALIPKLMDSTEEEENVTLCVHLIQSLLLMSSDMALVSLITPAFIREILQFSKSLLLLENGHCFFAYVSRLVYQILEFCLTRKDKSDIKIELNVIIPEMISCLIVPLAKMSKEPNSQDFEILGGMKLCFVQILESYCKRKAFNQISFKDILSTFVVAVLSDLTADIKRHRGYQMYDNLDEMPLISKFFLSIFATNIRLMTLFLTEVKTCVNSGDLLEFPGPLVVAALLHFLSHDKKYLKISIMKTALEAVQNLLTEAKTLLGDEEEKTMDDDSNISHVSFNKMAKSTADLLDQISDLLKGNNATNNDK
uniref:Methyltransferase domain-containing protein n=1 Tax=Strigamia maritima TaxID=126957 RepID=T1IVR8_STRMM